MVEKSKMKLFKKCRSCGLDCTIVRARATEKVADSAKKKVVEVMFGEGKPKYGTDNCPKR